jgi:hypothetical protein
MRHPDVLTLLTLGAHGPDTRVCSLGALRRKVLMVFTKMFRFQNTVAFQHFEITKIMQRKTGKNL